MKCYFILFDIAELLLEIAAVFATAPPFTGLTDHGNP